MSSRVVYILWGIFFSPTSACVCFYSHLYLAWRRLLSSIRMYVVLFSYTSRRRQILSSLMGDIYTCLLLLQWLRECVCEKDEVPLRAVRPLLAPVRGAAPPLFTGDALYSWSATRSNSGSEELFNCCMGVDLNQKVFSSNDVRFDFSRRMQRSVSVLISLSPLEECFLTSSGAYGEEQQCLRGL